MWQEIISIEGPYDFDSLLKKHDFDPLKKIDAETRTIKMPVLAGSTPHVVEMTSEGTIERPKFKLTGYHKADKAAVIEAMSEIFQWNVPLQPVYDHFQDTDLKEIFTAYYGTPLVSDYDLFGCLAKCIIFQQLNMPFAAKLTDRFIKNFGEQIGGVWFYPTPERVAGLTVEQLRELQFSTRKAEYVIDLARAIIQGDLDLDALKHETDEAIFQKLIKMRGIGQWTIENFLLFGLGRPNLFPMADIGLQNALKKFYNLEKKPTREQMEQYKKAWDPYLSYASFYLWRSIE